MSQLSDEEREELMRQGNAHIDAIEAAQRRSRAEFEKRRRIAEGRFSRRENLVAILSILGVFGLAIGLIVLQMLSGSCEGAIGCPTN